MIAGIVIRLPFFKREHTNDFVLRDQGHSHPGEARGFERWEARILPDIANQNSLPGANHLVEQRAILNSHGQPKASLGIRETFRRRDSEFIPFPQPQCGSVIGDNRFELIKKRGDQLVTLQAGGEGRSGIGQRSELRGTFLGGAHQSHVLERQPHLLREREKQGFIFRGESGRRVEIIQHKNSHRLVAGLDRDKQAGNWQTATGRLPIKQLALRGE